MPILREGELDIISHSAEQTRRLGARLGKLLQPGDVVCLSGDMGAGKTVFTSGVGVGWGAHSAVTSPTFNMVHQHSREKDDSTLYHLDCYRLQGPDDADSIGFDEILDGNGAVVIEWAERIESVLPDDRLWVDLRVVEDNRRNFIIEASGPRSKVLLQQFRAQAFGF